MRPRARGLLGRPEAPDSGGASAARELRGGSVGVPKRSGTPRELRGARWTLRTRPTRQARSQQVVAVSVQGGLACSFLSRECAFVCVCVRES